MTLITVPLDCGPCPVYKLAALTEDTGESYFVLFEPDILAAVVKHFMVHTSDTE
jgi:hypothetical protein